MKIHFTFWNGAPFQLRKGQEWNSRMLASRGQGLRGAPRGSWHSSLLSWNILLSCLHRSCAFQRWNEGQVLYTLWLHKTPGKDTESCSDKDMGTGNMFLLFPALPCCCRYWNFNPAVGYQEPGSHRSVDLWAATLAVPPVVLQKQLVVHPHSPGNKDMHSWSIINFITCFHIYISVAIYTQVSINSIFAHSSIMTAFVTL